MVSYRHYPRSTRGRVCAPVLSVRPSVPAWANRNKPLLQVCCCRKYRLIAARRTNAGSATLSAYVVAEHRPVISPTATLQFKLSHTTVFRGWLGSRVVSVLDSGAEGPGFKSQPRRCRVTVLGKLFTPIVPLFAKQQNW